MRGKQKEVICRKECEAGRGQGIPHPYNSLSKKQWSTAGGEKLEKLAGVLEGGTNEKKQLGEGRKMSLHFHRN